MHIYAVNEKGVSCRKRGVSWTKMVFPFSNVLNSVIFLLHLVQKVKFLYSSNVKATLAQMSVLFLEGGGVHA